MMVSNRALSLVQPPHEYLKLCTQSDCIVSKIAQSVTLANLSNISYFMALGTFLRHKHSG